MHPSALCVSIHDVAPHTWSRCKQWLHEIHAVADIPVTLLVVPNYHRYRYYNQPQFDHILEDRLEQGDELALHGYSHLDENAAPSTYWNKFVRHSYTQGEAEFYAIEPGEARKRLQAGLAWFNHNHWPITGFVAPAWLLGDGAWQALSEFPFKYTTTLRKFFLLPERICLDSQSLVFSARNGWLKHVSYARNSILQQTNRNAPLVRLGLHPNDILQPDIVKHAQRLIANLLESRVAMTKMNFATLWQEKMGDGARVGPASLSFIKNYQKGGPPDRQTTAR
jgi:predicted deacetylase